MNALKKFYDTNIFILGVRAVCFYILAALALLPVACIATPLALPFSHINRYRIVTSWNHACIWLAKVCCGIKYEVHGKENIPAGGYVIVAKHQSAWEAIYLQMLFTPLSTILKRELLWIPFFGWGMDMRKPIAIKRSSPKESLKQIQKQGGERLAEGIPILVFPEGTRTPYGKIGRYAKGGATLAVSAGGPLLPLAHNAGRYWPPKGFIKRPGTIQVQICAPIDTAGAEPAALTEQCKGIIEGTIEKMV